MSVRGFVHVVCAARWGHLLDHMVEHNCLQAHTAPLPWFSLFSGTSMCKTCTQTCTRSIVRASLLYDALSRHLALQRTQLANLCLLLSKSASTAAQAGWRHRSSYCWPFKLCCPFIVNLCCPRILLGSRAVCTTWACPSWGGGVTHRVPVELVLEGGQGGFAAVSLPLHAHYRILISWTGVHVQRTEECVQPLTASRAAIGVPVCGAVGHCLARLVL